MKKACFLICMIFFIFVCGACKAVTKNTTEKNYDINMWTKGNADICRSENGYYVAGENFIYTIENGTVMALCNKADCAHADKNCNAYLNNIQSQTIWYDGSKLFVVAGEVGGKYYIYELETDGSGSKKVCELFQTTGVKSFALECSYKEGYAYYVLELQTTSDITRGVYSQRLYRTKLEVGANPELIYENEDKSVSTSLGRCYFYENDMYVVINKRTTSGEKNSSALYRYSIKTNTIELFLDKYVSYYFVTDDILYYTTSDGIHKYNLNDKTDTIFYEEPVFCSSMCFDGKYIYLSDEWYWMTQEEHTDKVNIYILNLDGKLCKILSLDWGSNIFYGDGSCLVVKNIYDPQGGSPYSTSKYSFYDKEQIENGGEEWTSVEMEMRTAE